MSDEEEEIKIGKPGFVVFTNALASFLIAEGFKLIGVRPDMREPSRRVYIFDHCEGLEEAIKLHKNLFVRIHKGKKCQVQ
jgi:hypothetical protein